MGGNVVRFTVSRVMDMIERRLTTDVALAQAVVDVGEVARFAELDHGRPINLLRLGMVIDALARYLVDAGAMLYPVADRELLSENAMTSKERMVLTRWADDGLIEVTSGITDRVLEVADLTGLPLIVINSYDRYSSGFSWLRTAPERSLWLRPKSGAAALIPGWNALAEDVAPVAIGKAAVPGASQPVEPGEAVPGASQPVEPGETAVESQPEQAPETERVSETEQAPEPEADGETEPEATEVEASAEEISTREAVAVRDAVSRLDAAAAFLARGAIRMSSTRVVAERFIRAEPSAAGRKVLSREWRCHEPECPAFGGYRIIGQPVPRMRDGKPTCPRHGSPVTNIGPRPPAFPVVVVVDDLPRRRFVVDPSHPVTVGKAPSEPGDVSVAAWIHSPAAAWIAPSHLRLSVENRALVMTDTSENGTLVWRRTSSADPGTAERIRRGQYQLGEWDSLELYTGVELVVGNWYHATVVATSDVDSVMAEAPTVVLRSSEISA